MTVYCCSEFFNELETLSIKLETLYSLVDYFVIVESTKTHSGNDKVLYYQENKDRFRKFHDKIIHLIVDDTPENYQALLNMQPKNELHEKVIGSTQNAYWLDRYNQPAFIRDNYEKEYVIMGLENVNDNDIVLFGDLDEIPRPEALSKIIEIFEPEKAYHFQQNMFYCWYNVQKNEPWLGTCAISGKNALNRSLGEYRQFKEGVGIANGGWHFTYIGDAKKIIQKIESFSHVEFNLPFVKENVQRYIDNGLELGQDILGRPCEFVVRDINDGTFPKYLVDNQDKFAEHIRK